MFGFLSEYFVYRKLRRVPEKLSFRFKCPDTGTVRILGNILYRVNRAKVNELTTKPAYEFLLASVVNFSPRAIGAVCFSYCDH